METERYGKMFVVKCVARNIRLINATRNFIIAKSRSVNSSASLLFKSFSPEMSPEKVVVKKKRRISSSSEEEKQALTKESTSLKEKT